MYFWIYAFFSGLLFFLSISLIIRKSVLSSRLLGFHFLIMAFILVVVHLNFSGQMRFFPQFFKTASPAGYLLGPSYYFFVLATLRKDFKFRWVHLLHLLPFILHIIELTPFFISSTQEKLESYNVFFDFASKDPLQVKWGYFSYRINVILKVGLAISYFLASLYVVLSVPRESSLHRSSTARKILTWIKMDIFIKLLIFFFTIMVYVFFWLFPDSIYRLHFYTFPLSTFLSSLLLLFFPELSLFEYLSVSNEKEDKGKNRNWQSASVADANISLLTGIPSEKDGYANGCTEVMNLEGSGFLDALRKALEDNYFKEELDVPALARIMHLSERSLYRKIKDADGKSPRQILMDFRMEKAYALIQNDPNKSISQIAIEVGLKSNGNFSSGFFEKYGILPREFQKKAKSPG